MILAKQNNKDKKVFFGVCHEGYKVLRLSLLSLSLSLSRVLFLLFLMAKITTRGVVPSERISISEPRLRLFLDFNTGSAP